MPNKLFCTMENRHFFEHGSIPVKSITSMTMVVCLLAVYASAMQPNTIKTTVLANDESLSPTNTNYIHKPLVTTVYSNGLGTTLQTQMQKGSNDLVSCVLLNDFGMEERTLKPFMQYNNNHSYISLGTDGSNVTGLCKSYYQNNGYTGEDAPYSQNVYINDPLKRVASNSGPGSAFAGHGVNIWYFGITGTNNPSTYFRPDGFIQSSQLYDADQPASNIQAILNNYIPVALAGVYASDPTELKYHLTVTQDPNGNFSQEIKDLFGNSIATWSDPDGEGNTEAIVSQRYYDIAGRLRLEKPPMFKEDGTGVKADSFYYDKLGRLYQEFHPDHGTVMKKYDNLNRLLYCQTAVQRKNSELNRKNEYFVYMYDKLDRLVTTGILVNYGVFDNLTDQEPSSTDLNKSTIHKVKIRTIYDDREQAVSHLISTTITVKMLAGLTNTTGNIVANICYAEDGSKIMEVFSYDEEGRVNKKYKSIHGLPVQTFEYTYDFQGKVLTETYRSGSNTVTKQMLYNDDGLVREILVNGRKFVSYNYNDRGQITGRMSINNNNAFPYRHVGYFYNIRDWLTTINFGSIFFERIYYEANPSNDTRFIPQYNGNISIIATNFNSSLSSVFRASDIAYKYDKVNRLLKADNKSVTGADQMDGDFSYDNNGRFITKKEGNDTLGDYNYYPGKNQLKSINGSTRTGDNFVYDPNGNMILDRSKKMVVKYDWRDLPIEFIFYKTINADITNDTWYLVDNMESDDSNKYSMVRMVYDTGGNRVLKKEFKY